MLSKPVAALGGVAILLAGCGAPCPNGFVRNPSGVGECVAEGAYAPEADEAGGLVSELNERCNKGDGVSCEQLGEIYLEGTLVGRDAARGARYLARACERTIASACEKLGDAYAMDQALMNAELARDFYAKGCSLGQKSACDRVDRATTAGGSPSGDKPPDAGEVLLGAGTCFAVSADGLVVTAHHVVSGKDVVGVQFNGEEILYPKLEASSAAVDLAVLRVERKTSNYLRVTAAPSVGLGDEVFTIGFPAPWDLGWEAKFTEGTISSLSVRGEKALMQISVAVHGGNSGGALVSEDGVLFGVVVAKRTALDGENAENISYAVKASFLAPLLDAAVVHGAGKAMSRKSAIRLAEAATCKVLTATQTPPAP